MGSESREAENLNSDIREQAAQHTLAANPLVGVRGHDILASAGVLVGQMVKNPGAAAQQYLSFLGELGAS
jgi:poly[(R)-3-hydroxyalkanoate] polymerase subunit PhaC